MNVRKSSRLSIRSGFKSTNLVENVENVSVSEEDCKKGTSSESDDERKTRRTKRTEVLSHPTTPTKQKKTGSSKVCSDIESLVETPTTPSTRLENLTITSPKSAVTPKSHSLKEVYRNAKKALHSTVPSILPGREREVDMLTNFIQHNLNERKSGSMYISGPPGTGKTAALTRILEMISSRNCHQIYVNCTSIKSSGVIYSRLVKELDIKSAGKTEKENLVAFERFLTKNEKMIILVLDEIDQLDSKNQSVLYTIFEWPSKSYSKIILIGIANALDLTDRILPRLQARCELKPNLLHFAPYSKQQIIQILTYRLSEAEVLEMFPVEAIQLLAAKVASISGDIRRALDIARRVIEIVEQENKSNALHSIENLEKEKTLKLSHVLKVLNSVYGTTNNLSEEDQEDAFPLQQKLVICSLILILKKNKTKDVMLGKLHEVYRKVCKTQNIGAVDQAEFVSLCTLVETRGIIKVCGKGDSRLHKVVLQWDEDEVVGALKDKTLLSGILQNDNLLTK